MSKPQVTFERPGQPVSHASLDAVEARLGITLPKWYRAFLRKQNGGRPSPHLFYAEGYGTGMLDRFYSVGEPAELTEAFAIYKDAEHARVPPEYLPIADCECSDLICADERGRLFVWFHEEEGGESYIYDNLHLVAANLDEFLASLRPDEE